MEVTSYGNNNYCTLRRELCFRADNRAQLGQIYNRVKTCTYQTILSPLNKTFAAVEETARGTNYKTNYSHLNYLSYVYFRNYGSR